MFAVFRSSKPWEFSMYKLFTVAVTLLLMMSQQALKKASVKSSGPGALSGGMDFIVSLISSCVNGASRADKYLGT